MRTGLRILIVLVTSTLLGIACAGEQMLSPHLTDGEVSTAVSSGNEPTAPSDANVVGIASSYLMVAWQDNSGNETGFQIERAVAGGAFRLLPADLRSNTTLHNDSGLQASTEYCYRIRAVRTKGTKSFTSAFSNAACATTVAPEPPPPPPPPPPTPPAWFAIGVTPYHSTAVWMTWGITLYTGQFRIERSIDGQQSWSVAQIVSGNTGYVVDSGLTSDRQVCYRVIGFDATGVVAQSDPDCATPPAGPTNLAASTRADGSVLFTWSDNSAVEDGYELWVQIVTDNVDCPAGCTIDISDYLLVSLPANSTSYTCLAGCAGILTYVKATKDGGASTFSNYVRPSYP